MNRPKLKAKVLMVDDEADFALAIKCRLERDFEVVDYVADEEQALAMLEKTRYDLVILDIMLEHDAGGLRLCRRLKAEPRWRDTPIMMLSSADVSYGLSIRSFLTDGECLPAEDFVDKIQDPEEIVLRARRMVERPDERG